MPKRNETALSLCRKKIIVRTDDYHRFGKRFCRRTATHGDYCFQHRTAR